MARISKELSRVQTVRAMLKNPRHQSNALFIISCKAAAKNLVKPATRTR